MTSIGCVSITGCQAGLGLLERVTYPRAELAVGLPRLRAATHARGLAVLSTCQQTEIYATWSAAPDTGALAQALATDRDVAPDAIAAAATAYHDDAAVRHLLRVATGLESFVPGETEIAGQVRAAAEAGRLSGGGDVVLDRLMCTAISASRQAHRCAAVATTSRSVAGVGLDRVVRLVGGTLSDRRLLVVGAGQVAAVVVAEAKKLGAEVTVCNRTRRHAERFARAGATVVDLDQLARCLATTDIAILATAAPHLLVDAELVRSARPPGGRLILVDLSLPRNVAPSVRQIRSVLLLDLADLAADGASEAAALADDIAAIEEVIETELARFRRWSSGRSVAGALRRVRDDADQVARQEIARIRDELPPDARLSVERALFRTTHRLVHGTIRQVLAAAEAGDTGMIAILAGLYDDGRAANDHGRAINGRGRAMNGRGWSAADDPHATARLDGSALDAKRSQVCAREQAAYERGVHAAHELAV